MDYKGIIANYPILSDEEQKALLATGRKEDRDRVALGYMKYLVKLARCYVRNGNEHDLEDALHEAFIGLTEGLEKFNPSEGTKVQTWIHSWAKRDLRTFRPRTSPMRIPINVWAMVRQYRKIEETLSEGGHKTVDFETVFSHMVLKATTDKQRQKVKMRLFQALNQPVSIDWKNTKTGSDEKLELEDKHNLLAELMQTEEYKLFTDKIKFRLTNEERKLLDLKQEGHKRKEIAEIMGITMNKLTQLEARIIQMLKD